jgi:glycosyltransferase involved in cell wall biosynthesis
MNIWFFSAYDQPKGQSSRTYDYAKELISFGHKVTFFTSSYNHFTRTELLSPNEKWRTEEIEGINVVWLKTIPYRDYFFSRGLNMLSNAWRAYMVGSSMEEKPDFVFGPSVPLFTALSAYFVSRKKKSLFCFEIRDIWPQALIDLGILSKESIVTWLLHKIEVFLYERADCIITVLPYAQKYISRYNSKKNIFWLPNGVNLDRFNIPKDKEKRTKDFTLMYVGQFSATHDIETIIKATKILQEENNINFRVVLVGGGKKERIAKEMVKNYNIKNIEFRGFVEKSEIPKIQNEADVFIASVKKTNVYQFGINSNKIFDYLASGRPIIFTADIPGNPIKKANAGISIPAEDSYAMAEAIKKMYYMSSKKRNEIGKNGKDYLENNYNVEVLAKRLEDILLSIKS